ncbi:putative polysaccharide biosynthesis protein [Scatolibacter rhodanostii]|uniref:putative polysaccharide biosynthesis protein n=1 Tax=Scatolibacter rhodanostii TaxID=2014781 RepID=UPI0013565B17|nr:polysaccharide biosynthesis protein [Scatolibacter rhodanostii]
MSNEKGQSFLKGAAILSASTLIVKFVSFFFSIPLTNIIGTAGLAPYNATYTIFAVFNAIATAGLPVAVSKMVSSAYSLGNPRQAEKTFSIALRTFSILGLVLSILMFLFSDLLASIVHVPGATYSIKALAPTVFFASIMSATRGFFQGKSNMKPTALSQLIEAIIKLIFGLSLALYIHTTFQNAEYSSAAAIIGISFSAFCGAVYLTIRKRKDRRQTLSHPSNSSRRVDSSKVILNNLIRIAVPITIGSCLLFVLDLFDASIINSRLQTYLSKEAAEDLYGAWGAAIRLFDLPGAITIPIATSLIPVISVAFTQRDAKKVARSTTSAIRMTLLITVPCTVGFFLFGQPIAHLAYFSKNVSADIIGSILQTVSIGIVFNGLLYTTNSLMQAMGHVTQPVINMTIGGIVRLVLNYVLIGNPAINIQGAAITTSLSYLITLVLNLISVYRLVPKAENILLSFLPVALASAVMGAASYFSFLALSSMMSEKIAVLIAIAVAVLVYFPAAILFKAIRKNELMMLPMGGKIAKIFHLYEGAHFG